VTRTNLSLRRLRAFGTASALSLLVIAGKASAQQSPSLDYYVGNAGVGLPVAPSAPATGGEKSQDTFAPVSKNVRMYGALYSVESCVYDARRGVIVAPSRGVNQSVRANDAWIAFINHDGSVHTPRWLGIQRGRGTG